jgi:hypothetical protein
MEEQRQQKCCLLGRICNLRYTPKGTFRIVCCVIGYEQTLIILHGTAQSLGLTFCRDPREVMELGRGQTPVSTVTLEVFLYLLFICSFIVVFIILNTMPLYQGRDSSVGIATRYGLDGPGIESLWGEIFRTLPDRPWGPPNLLYNGYRVFSGGKAAGAWC